MHEIDLRQGTIRYREVGSGPPVVLVHGLLVNSLLWEDVAARLASRFRVIVPDWPLGAHAVPMLAGADLSPSGLARLIGDFLSALELSDVTLVGNDTGGALCQLVALDHGERVGRLVLTPCDAYERFLPPLFKPLQVLPRVPGAMWMVAQTMRWEPAQRLPVTFGRLSKAGIDPAVVREFVRPVQTDARIRRDAAAVLRAISSRYTIAAAARFGEFSKPVLLAWAPEDPVFPFAHAERMAAEFPDARLERIEDSYGFVPIDQPARTAELIAGFI